MVIISTSNVDFFSVYPLGNEALVVLSNLSQLMAEKNQGTHFTHT